MSEPPYVLQAQGWKPVAKDAYKGEEVETYVCSKCKTDKFIVGCGDCQTLLKCPNCGWEEVIHDG